MNRVATSSDTFRAATLIVITMANYEQSATNIAARPSTPDAQQIGTALLLS
ncbi:MAG: hypothetical protein ABFE07_12170 [Armatimonadia bacterium]